MVNETKTYRRKISDEEAQGNYILILKNALDLFPKAGIPFKLVVKGNEQKTEKEFDVTISIVQRWSIGPNKPQNNYKIDTKSFRDIFPIHFGKKIVITKSSDDKYILT